MTDIYLGWNGDIEFAANGDLRTATFREVAEQRVVRRLLTNPAVRDAQGNIVRRGDDLTNQDYGKGLGQQVDAIATAEGMQIVHARIRAALAEEPDYVDLTVAPVITFQDFPAQGVRAVTVEFQTLVGERANVNLSL